MFTGIIEEIGVITALRRGARSARVTVRAGLVAQDAAVGDSIAISGVCLTVVAIEGGCLTFDAVPATIDRTSLKSAATGTRVNLERALAVGQRFGGHFVQGHVDGTGQLVSIREEENARVLRIGAPPNYTRYMVEKGSVALDGISLTIVDPGRDWFTVWIIPHTWQATTLCDRRPGDLMNIEVDLIARHIERLLAARGDIPGITPEKLAAAGFPGASEADL